MADKAAYNADSFYFLSGGGEMGQLIRAKDWTETPLGNPQNWPQALKTMVAVMLDNPFGMYIAWGKEFTQLYNDGYRPILGATKHPEALGISTRQTFSEIMDIIGPMFDDVMNGKAIGFPDFMLPLNRFGYVEECYFDFSYSPIRTDDGKVGGVLVTVIETTNKKKAEDSLKESEAKFRMMADNIPNLAWMANADGWIYWYNKKWFDYTGKTAQEMEGWGWQSVHDPIALPHVVKNWKDSISSGQPFEMVFPLRGADGTFRQFLTRVLPVFDSEGKLYQWFGTNTDITNQINAEQTATESEKRFRLMAEDTDILIATSDETSNATYFNQAWCNFTGRSAEELLNYGWADLIHEEDRDKFVSQYLKSFELREPWIGEFRMLNNEQEYHWILAKGSPRFYPDGSFAGYISSSIDIHERKITEERLIESEQKVRSLIESAPFPIGVYTGKEMKIVLANQTIMDVWGKGNDVVGKLYSDILPELENQEIFEQLDRVYTTGVPFHARHQRVDLVINGNLQAFYFNYSFTPLFDAGNKVYGVMNTAAEVTELVVAQKGLERSEKNLHNMILQAPVAMCILLGPDHIIEVANENMIRLWGKESWEVLKKPVFDALPEARDQGLEQLLANAFKEGETFKANERPVDLLRNGKLETVYQNFVYQPYYSGEGKIIGVLAVSIDVTAQVLARQKIEEIVSERTRELANANSNLQRSNAELAQFAYIASHDLQEPLRKITTFGQMLQSSLEGKLDVNSGKYLNKILHSSTRMNTLIRDVLAYSELVKDKELFSEVDLNKVVENICADFDLLMEQRHARIIAEKLPVVSAIPLQMSQLFGNLISNALKFAKKDVPPVIQISARKDKLPNDNGSASDFDYWNIEVRDNGIGFKKEYSEQIFNIFQRLHGKTEYEGTGIGLAMCKKIALNHKGDITAENSSEEGAVFNVYIPA